MGVLTRDGILTRNSRFISRPGSREALPPLSELAGFSEWVAVSNSYFRLFADSDDRLANFRQAFGEEWTAFDAALRNHVAQLRP